jgi:hypothetical protein
MLLRTFESVRSDKKGLKRAKTHESRVGTFDRSSHQLVAVQYPARANVLTLMKNFLLRSSGYMSEKSLLASDAACMKCGRSERGREARGVRPYLLGVLIPRHNRYAIVVMHLHHMRDPLEIELGNPLLRRWSDIE